MIQASGRCEVIADSCDTKLPRIPYLGNDATWRLNPAHSPRWNEFLMRVPAQRPMKMVSSRRKLLSPCGPEVVGLNGAV